MLPFNASTAREKMHRHGFSNGYPAHGPSRSGTFDFEQHKYASTLPLGRVST
jgi:hypothetical protein